MFNADDMVVAHRSLPWLCRGVGRGNPPLCQIQGLQRWGHLRFRERFLSRYQYPCVIRVCAVCCPGVLLGLFYGCADFSEVLHLGNGDFEYCARLGHRDLLYCEEGVWRWHRVLAVRGVCDDLLY